MNKAFQSCFHFWGETKQEVVPARWVWETATKGPLAFVPGKEKAAVR